MNQDTRWYNSFDRYPHRNRRDYRPNYGKQTHTSKIDQSTTRGHETQSSLRQTWQGAHQRHSSSGLQSGRTWTSRTQSTSETQGPLPSKPRSWSIAPQGLPTLRPGVPPPPPPPPPPQLPSSGYVFGSHNDSSGPQLMGLGPYQEYPSEPPPGSLGYGFGTQTAASQNSHLNPWFSLYPVQPGTSGYPFSTLPGVPSSPGYSLRIQTPSLGFSVPPPQCNTDYVQRAQLGYPGYSNENQSTTSGCNLRTQPSSSEILQSQSTSSFQPSSFGPQSSESQPPPSTSRTSSGRPPESIIGPSENNMTSMEETADVKPVTIEVKSENVDVKPNIDCVDLCDPVESPEERFNRFHYDTRIQLQQLVSSRTEMIFLQRLRLFKVSLENQIGEIILKEQLMHLLERFLLFIRRNFDVACSGYTEEYLTLMEDIMVLYGQVVSDYALGLQENTSNETIRRRATIIKYLLAKCLLYRVDSIMHFLFKVKLSLEKYPCMVWTDVFVNWLRYIKYKHKNDDYLRCFIAWQRFKTLRAPSDYPEMDRAMYRRFNRSMMRLKRIPRLKQIMNDMETVPRYSVRDMLKKYWQWWEEERLKDLWTEFEEPTLIDLPGEECDHPRAPTSRQLDEVGELIRDRKTGRKPGLVQLAKEIRAFAESSTFESPFSDVRPFNFFDDNDDFPSGNSSQSSQEVLVDLGIESRIVEIVEIQSDEDDDDVIFVEPSKASGLQEVTTPSSTPLTSTSKVDEIIILDEPIGIDKSEENKNAESVVEAISLVSDAQCDNIMLENTPDQSLILSDQNNKECTVFQNKSKEASDVDTKDQINESSDISDDSKKYTESSMESRRILDVSQKGSNHNSVKITTIPDEMLHEVGELQVNKSEEIVLVPDECTEKSDSSKAVVKETVESIEPAHILKENQVEEELSVIPCELIGPKKNNHKTIKEKDLLKLDTHKEKNGIVLPNIVSPTPRINQVQAELPERDCSQTLDCIKVEQMSPNPTEEHYALGNNMCDDDESLFRWNEFATRSIINLSASDKIQLKPIQNLVKSIEHNKSSQNSIEESSSIFDKPAPYGSWCTTEFFDFDGSDDETQIEDASEMSDAPNEIKSAPETEFDKNQTKKDNENTNNMTSECVKSTEVCILNDIVYETTLNEPATEMPDKNDAIQKTMEEKPKIPNKQIDNHSDTSNDNEVIIKRPLSNQLESQYTYSQIQSALFKLVEKIKEPILEETLPTIKPIEDSGNKDKLCEENDSQTNAFPDVPEDISKISQPKEINSVMMISDDVARNRDTEDVFKNSVTEDQGRITNKLNSDKNEMHQTKKRKENHGIESEINMQNNHVVEKSDEKMIETSPSLSQEYRKEFEDDAVLLDQSESEIKEASLKEKNQPNEALVEETSTASEPYKHQAIEKSKELLNEHKENLENDMSNTISDTSELENSSVIQDKDQILSSGQRIEKLTTPEAEPDVDSAGKHSKIQGDKVEENIDVVIAGPEKQIKAKGVNITDIYAKYTKKNLERQKNDNAKKIRISLKESESSELTKQIEKALVIEKKDHCMKKAIQLSEKSLSSKEPINIDPSSVQKVSVMVKINRIEKNVDTWCLKHTSNSLTATQNNSEQIEKNPLKVIKNDIICNQGIEMDNKDSLQLEDNIELGYLEETVGESDSSLGDNDDYNADSALLDEEQLSDVNESPQIENCIKNPEDNQLPSKKFSDIECIRNYSKTCNGAKSQGSLNLEDSAVAGEILDKNLVHDDGKISKSSLNETRTAVESLNNCETATRSPLSPEKQTVVMTSQANEKTEIKESTKSAEVKTTIHEQKIVQNGCLVETSIDIGDSKAENSPKEITTDAISSSEGIQSHSLADVYTNFAKEVSVDTQDDNNANILDSSLINLASPNTEDNVIMIQCRSILQPLKEEDDILPDNNGVTSLPDSQTVTFLLTPNYEFDQQPFITNPSTYEIVVPPSQKTPEEKPHPAGSQPYSPQYSPIIGAGNVATNQDESSPHEEVNTLIYTPILRDIPKPISVVNNKTISPSLKATGGLKTAANNPVNIKQTPIATKHHSVTFFEEKAKEIYAKEYGGMQVLGDGSTRGRGRKRKMGDSGEDSYKLKRKSQSRTYKPPKMNDRPKKVHITAEDNDLFQNAIEGPTGKPLPNTGGTAPNMFWDDTEESNKTGTISVKSNSQLYKSKNENLVSILKRPRPKGEFEPAKKVDFKGYKIPPALASTFHKEVVINLKRSDFSTERFRQQEAEAEQHRKSKKEPDLKAIHDKVLQRARMMQLKQQQARQETGILYCIFTDQWNKKAKNLFPNYDASYSTTRKVRFKDDTEDDHNHRNHRNGQRKPENRTNHPDEVPHKKKQISVRTDLLDRKPSSSAPQMTGTSEHNEVDNPIRKKPKTNRVTMPNDVDSTENDSNDSIKNDAALTKSGRVSKKPSGKDYYDVTESTRGRRKTRFSF